MLEESSVELAKGFKPKFKIWAVVVVKVDEPYEGMECLTGCRKGPVRDHVKFRCGRAVSIRGEVVADILYFVFEELAFVEFEADPVFLKDAADSFEVNQDTVQVGGPY